MKMSTRASTDARAKLEAKLRRNPAAILGESEIKILEAEARRIMGPQYAALFEGNRFANQLRWSPLSKKCEQLRGKRGMSLRGAAIATGIPKYRLEAIEKGSVTYITPRFAQKYFEFLGLESWVKRWSRSNKDLARQAGIGPAVDKVSSSKLKKGRAI